MALKIYRQIQEIPSDVAVVEYISSKEAVRWHEVSRKKNVYIKTKPSIKKKIKEKLKNLPPKGAEKKLNSETADDFSKERNNKQLKNYKHAFDKASRPDSAPMKNMDMWKM